MSPAPRTPAYKPHIARLAFAAIYTWAIEERVMCRRQRHDPPEPRGRPLAVGATAKLNLRWRDPWIPEIGLPSHGGRHRDQL